MFALTIRARERRMMNMKIDFFAASRLFMLFRFAVQRRLAFKIACRIANYEISIAHPDRHMLPPAASDAR